jgi:putative transposase
LEPRTTPLESPQSNGMAEAFVRTIKRDYARVSSCPDARSVMAALPGWFAHYNQLHPHRALGYRSPREFIADRQPRKPCPLFKGQQHLREFSYQPVSTLSEHALPIVAAGSLQTRL